MSNDMVDSFRYALNSIYGYKSVWPERYTPEQMNEQLNERLHKQFNTMKGFEDLFNSDWPAVTDTVNFKRYHKPIMDRIIDLTVFYEQVTGLRPHKLLVGYEEMGEIMKANRAVDMVGYSRPAGAMGTLNGMAVMQEPAKHHLECV